MYIIAE